MRRRRQHGVPVTRALVLLALLAVIAAAFWVAGHLALLAVTAAVADVAFRLGRHECRRARPGQVQPPRWRPEEPAAASALPAATLPLAGHGQDGGLADERPARLAANRTRLLADPLSGAHPLSQLRGAP